MEGADRWFDSEAEKAAFCRGSAHFNAGRWFEAHETWEELWLAAEGPRKRFYQGLIQCAVMLEHARRGNVRGVRSLWRTAIPKFEGLEPVYLGMALPEFLAAIASVVRPVLEDHGDGAPSPTSADLDWSKVPRIACENQVER